MPSTPSGRTALSSGDRRRLVIPTNNSAIIDRAENPAVPSQNPAFDLGPIGTLRQLGEAAILVELDFHLDILETPEFAQSRVEGLVDRLLGTEDRSTATTALVRVSAFEPVALMRSAHHPLEARLDRFVRLHVHAESQSRLGRRDCDDAHIPSVGDRADNILRPDRQSIRIAQQREINVAQVGQQAPG